LVQPAHDRLNIEIVQLRKFPRSEFVIAVVARYEEGRFEGLRVVRSIQPGTDQALLASLSGWEFRAATKDGVGVMVEFLLSIPAKGL
jgi:hypothetical protein